MDNQNETYGITLNTLIRCMGTLMPFIEDKEIFEIYVNPDGKVWIDTFTGRRFSGVDISPAQTKQIIMNVAALTNQIIPANMPILSAEIPDSKYFESCRFQGNLPNVVAAPTINIRKHPKKIFTLDDYVAQKTMSLRQKEIIIKAIHAKQNIITAGATKSGKTTLLNAILAEISTLNDRVIMIEDTPELRCTAKDYVSMRTTNTVTMDDCLRSVLRMTPDRIVVGEVRGGEALALLDAWSTGHGGGCSTVHSNNAKDTLLRLENMTSRVSQNPQQTTIAQAVNMVIYLRYNGNRRIIEDIIQLDGYDSIKKEYIYHKID